MTGGARSMLAFWMGGAAGPAGATPESGTPQPSGFIVNLGRMMNRGGPIAAAANK